MFTKRAYVHRYESLGITTSDLLDSFSACEQIVADYADAKWNFDFDTDFDTDFDSHFDTDLDAHFDAHFDGDSKWNYHFDTEFETEFDIIK